MLYFSKTQKVREQNAAQKTNVPYLYAKDCMDNRSIRVANIREAIEAVHPTWKAMAANEKALEWKASIKSEKNQFEIKSEPILLNQPFGSTINKILD